MKITTDKDRCISSGQCVFAAPAVFDQDEDAGQVVVLQESPAGEDAEAAREAAMMCPAQVITIED